jgi:phosphatidylserine decarboxylase
MRMCKDGWPFVLGCLFAGLLFFGLASHFQSTLWAMLMGLALLAAAFCAYFFRDPHRVIPQGENLILSPADGKIMEIVEGKDPSSAEPVRVMRIFLSVFEPHIQRAPVRGKIQAIQYKKGRFLDARDPQACFENEQNRIEIQQGSGPIVVTQIAGLIARRILCWVKTGQEVQAGERIGLIRFGSQVDVVLPKSVTLKVKAGDFVTAGDTVIAER